MHLFELTEIERTAPQASVPEWVLGCFRRRSISFFTGASDETTEVIWLQTRGLTADYRFPKDRPAVLDSGALKRLSPEELRLVLGVEGGFARTRWDGEAMHFSDWISFQTHPKWPEPGRLTRVGDCMIEFAPSGAYVEDWRFDAPGNGPLIGLSLLEETDLDERSIRHTGGGLIVCGEHAGFVRGRPNEMPERRLTDLIRESRDDADILDLVFGFDAAYARKSSASSDFVVTRATSPWREGQPLLDMTGFSYDAESDIVVQRTTENGRAIERRFAIDTLEREFRAVEATAPTAEGRAWFDRERSTLLR